MSRHSESSEAKILLTVEEAAARLAVGRTSMFALIKAGEIASVLIGRSRRVPAAAVEAYAARLVAKQCPQSATGSAI
jgi:excisionase family DNA binding protein